MSMRDYGQLNILNSISQHWASALLREGFLCYWQSIDALQIADTATGWYLRYSNNRNAILATPAVQAAVASAKGVVTLVPAFPTVPRFLTRLINELTVGKADEVPIPASSLELGAPSVIAREGLGTKAKFRSRRITVDNFVRSERERALLEDLLSETFDEDTVITVRNHSDGSQAPVGEVQILESAVASTQVVTGTEAQTYEVLLNARLVYVA